MASSQTNQEPSAAGGVVANYEPNSTGVEGQAPTPEKPCTTTDTEEPLFPLRPTRLRRETKVSSSTIDDAFEELRKKGQTPTQAILSLLSRFNLSDLKTFTEKINCSFSNVTYEEIAPLFDLKPRYQAEDMKPLTLQRSRLPAHHIRKILEALRVKENVLGSLRDHENENARVRYLDGLIDLVIHLFGKTIRNKPEQKLIGAVTKDGAIEYQFVALSAIIVLFIEVKKVNLEGKNLCKAIAQVIEESDACDIFNEENGFWVPIRGILTDGEKMIFFEYRSDTRAWMKSDDCDGLPSGPRGTNFVIGVRRVSELLFDFLLMGYIDSLEAHYHESVIESRKRNVDGSLIQDESTTQWKASLEDAREALKLARQANEMVVTWRSRMKMALYNAVDHKQDDHKQDDHKQDDHKQDDHKQDDHKQDPMEVASNVDALADDALEFLKKSLANAPIPKPANDGYDEKDLLFGDFL